MRKSLIVLLACVAVGTPGESAIITINPTPTLASNLAALSAFNRAAGRWGSLLRDNVNVTIDADVRSFGPGSAGTIGQASSVLLQAGYSVIRNAIVADGANETDDAILAALPVAAQFQAIVPVRFSLSGSIAATKANLKALGFAGLDGAFGAQDALIEFNSDFAFDFDPSNGISAGTMDFESVAAHEIGHALGFVSAVDNVDFLVANSQTAALNLYSLDLFRFAQANVPNTTAEFTTNPRNLMPGLPAFFSDSNVSHGFSTGVFTGDARQASHWKDSTTPIGMMDPTLAPGQSFSISKADLRALDLIGWDTTAVPEPGSILLLSGGLAGLLFLRRPRAH
jgi:hypothetical protein